LVRTLRNSGGSRDCGNLRKVLAVSRCVIGDIRGTLMESQGRRSPHPEPMRCDHCRKSFGLILHRYFRMRFCSSDCLKAYQRRLDELTTMKIQHIDLSLPNEGAPANYAEARRKTQ